MLNKIIETKKQELKKLSLPEKQHVKRISFYKALKNRKKNIGLIAEVKKASPSKGMIKEDFHPVEIAKGYEAGGANAVSVLTDRQYFQGDANYLTRIKKEIHLPVLRKDFIIDPLQVEESDRLGADAILLIAEAIPTNELYQLYLLAEEKGMDALVEVHAKESLENILKTFTPKIIGVNNRNLKTFQTSLEQTEKMSSMIPNESLFISESGIFTAADLNKVKKAGADAVLVGESLMKAESPEIGIRTLYGGYVQQ